MNKRTLFICLGIATASLLIGVTGYLLLGANKESERLNVLIISIDTLRADHLSCYGYSRQTSPHIDDFAREGVLFERCIAQATTTLPSHSSIMTSRYASQHKAMKEDDFVRPLDASEITLSEVLKDHGYITASFNGGGEISDGFGLSQGFDVYDDGGGGMKKIVQRSLSWLGKRPEGPFFLFLHTYDCHYPYVPPPEYAAPYLDEVNEHVVRRMYRDFSKGRADGDDLTNMVALYDGEIAHMDVHLGSLLEGLQALGLEERTLVVFTSDHGEEFMEHGGLSHGDTAYVEATHVPLLVKCPGIEGGKRIDAQVSSIDIMPTVLDILGIPGGQPMEGTSLRTLMEEGTASSRIAISENEIRSITCVRSDEYSLFYEHPSWTEGVEVLVEAGSLPPQKEDFESAQKSYALYNLETDPMEQTELISQGHSAPKPLEDRLNQWIRLVEKTGIPSEALERVDMDQRTRDQLRHLGYMP